MATHGDKIDELFKIAHTLIERVDTLRAELQGMRREISKFGETSSEMTTQDALLKQELVALKAWKDSLGSTETKSDVTILKEQVKKLREEIDRAGSRMWAIVPNVIGAIVSGVIAFAVAYFVAKR